MSFSPVASLAPCQVTAASGPTSYADASGVRAAVWEALDGLELPQDYFRPGDRVVLKPNWVKEHDERRPGPRSWEHMITHPSVIEAVIDWVAPRLGRGSVTICDGPQTDSSFRDLKQYCGLEDLVARCQARHGGISLGLLDLRPEEWRTVDGVTVAKTVLHGDPLGSTRVVLHEASEFVDYRGLGRLYGASFDMAETNLRHQGAFHEYLLCRTPMDATVFINLPKLKTHKKVGMTCSLKNLVGINANKNWLPHHTEGTPDQGGDQFPTSAFKNRLEHSALSRLKRMVKDRPLAARCFVPLKKIGRLVFGDTQKVVRSGNWHGNDTCWRMVLDLNKCLFFFDGTGQPRTEPLRYLALVDGIIGGEGDGPLAPDPKPCGMVLAGTHPVAVDLVAARLMGFDWHKLRMLRQAFDLRGLSFVNFQAEDVRVKSHASCWQGACAELKGGFGFRPHFGWTGAIELDRA
jgi:uncharacterized protein (DUF362 family)